MFITLVHFDCESHTSSQADQAASATSSPPYRGTVSFAKCGGVLWCCVSRLTETESDSLTSRHSHSPEELGLLGDVLLRFSSLPVQVARLGVERFLHRFSAGMQALMEETCSGNARRICLPMSSLAEFKLTVKGLTILKTRSFLRDPVGWSLNWIETTLALTEILVTMPSLLLFLRLRGFLL